MFRACLRCVPTLAVAAFLALSISPLAAEEPSFKPIFNGKDLAGWEGDPSLWSVQDGAITGVTTAEHPLKYNKFLIWRGGAPKNFELHAKLRLIGNNNSGIQYRSKQLKDAGDFVVGGYQMDVHPSPNYNSMLYDERGRGILAEVGQKVVVNAKGELAKAALKSKPSPVKLDEWNDYTIIAQGNHLIHKINGHTTVDVTDNQPSERELEGIIALQVHAGPPMKAQFKEISLKTLPDAPPAPEPTSLSKLKPLKGFQVDLVHVVAREGEGSWVSMTIDPKNRLIVSDQYGKLFRVTPSPLGSEASETKIEPINVEIGEAQGLLWAFDSLYVVVNAGGKYESGLYRVRDTNGDDQLDKVEPLRKLNGGGEHGPHAVVLSPDKKSLYIVAGNATQLTEISSSLVPKLWGEDNLTPHMPDGSGFMSDEKAPGGCVYKVDPDGKSWELVSTGYRNAYDMAFNHQGELFTYDSDMEWDMNLPWYRPTRVCHVVSGAEFGYRNGSGKWPTYYLDSLPPVADIGPGSPTGVAFGYGAKFPSKYQDALYICDWSYGKLYALHLKPQGASYTADVEEFLSGTPLPLTDMVVNPHDGALYFLIGGRRTTSGLYRVVYKGEGPTSPSTASSAGADARALRHKLEAFHGHTDPRAVETAWPQLASPDRFIRFAARVAIEWQPADAWRDKALAETDPAKALQALLALARVSTKDPLHKSPADPSPDLALRSRLLASLDCISDANFSQDQKLDLVRVYQVVFNRFGKPDNAESARVIARFDRDFPGKSRDLNVETARVLVFLGAPDAASKVVDLLEKAPTQEEQIQFASILRVLRTGWTPKLREAYFSWFPKASAYKGGNSFGGFMTRIRNDSLADLSDSEKASIKSLLDAKPASSAPAVAASVRPFVKKWALDELVPLVDANLKHRDFDRGRTLFAATACFACHRFNNEGGGAGPELTGLAGRYTTRDLLESIVVPSKVISDQYAAVIISTTDGQVVTGRIVNLNGDNININTNMLDPNLQVSVDRRKIEEQKPSPTSMMPEGLLDTLNRDEVLDLVAYLLSRGDRHADMFK